jgi:hypothetical protein
MHLFNLLYYIPNFPQVGNLFELLMISSITSSCVILIQVSHIVT